MGRQLDGWRKPSSGTHGKCRALYAGLLVFCVIQSVGVSSDAGTEESSSESWSTIDGKEIYARFCAHCHGEQGMPPENMIRLLTPPPADLTLENYRYGDSLEEVKRSIRQGIGSNMLRFKERLSEEQIEAVSQYVLSLKKNSKIQQSQLSTE